MRWRRVSRSMSRPMVRLFRGGEGAFGGGDAGVVVGDFDGSYGSFGGVEVGDVVWGLVLFEYLGEFFECFSGEAGAQSWVFGDGQEAVAAEYGLEVEAGAAA